MYKPKFEHLLFLSAFFLATMAAIFSVTGLSELFAGASLFVGLMAGAMEFGKLMSVNFLYRYWTRVSKILRMYLIVGSIVLSLITSAGIYSYLTASYSTSAKDIQAKQNQVTLYMTESQQKQQDVARLTQRQTQLQNFRGQQENRMDSMVAKNRSTYSQQASIRTQDAEIKSLQTQISQESSQQDSLETLIATTKNAMTGTSHIGPFYYFAQSIGVSLDKVIKWFVLILTVVFDPLSLSLFLGYNTVLKYKENEEEETPIEEPVDEPEPDIPEEVVPVAALVPKIVPDIPSSSENGALTGSAMLVPKDMTPYYMKPDFRWSENTNWHTDKAAMDYYTALGIKPK